MSLYELSAAERAEQAIAHAADLAWQPMSQSFWARNATGEALGAGSIPQVSQAAAQQRSDRARTILELLDSVELEQAGHESQLTARLLRYYAEHWVKDAGRYWVYFDVSGIMFGGPFVQTAYTGGFLFNGLNASVSQYRFERDSDGDRYLAVLADIARLLRQIFERTEGQAERGIRIHKPQLPGVRSLLAGLKAAADTRYRVSDERIAALSGPAALKRQVDRRVDEHILPAFQALIDQLDADYEAQAPEGVGMDKLPGGREVYADLVRMHTTMDMTPEQVHAAGHARMARIEAEMGRVRDKLGFSGTADEFRTWLKQQPGAVAANADEIGEKMRRHKDRVEARFDEFFAQRSPAPYDLVRLDTALESNMTWGYYEGPSPSEPRGLYHYNGSKLDSQAVVGAASLTFHELVPGHHLHMTLQFANTRVHPIRRFAFVNAYNEGWAEYAATLTGEMGLYDDPYDYYGRLIFDAFLTCRLVVDTGMNALGWSWEQAQDYMREHSYCNDGEIASDTLRYSCGIPAQSLAYKLGDEEILRMRAALQEQLGEAYSHKDFHSAVLGVGSLPLPVLEWHLDEYARRQLAA